MPDDVPPWELLRSEQLEDARVFRLRRDLARSPRSGREHTFFTLEAPDWVNVVPLTADGHVVMVRQFRHGSRETTLEIPGGMVDPGESPAEAAARELLEETGYAAPAVSLLGSVNPNPALFGNACSTWLAAGAERVAPIRNEGGEETRVVLVPLAEIPDRMRSGEITHALVIAAFHWYGLSV
ncbi:MAG: NUDIX hydrolase [Planctomycetota bacterium]|nr:NUDIX hydrolase [Planctomycetota bacterium]